MFDVGVEKLDNLKKCDIRTGSVCGAINDIAPCRAVPGACMKMPRRPGQCVEIHYDVPSAKIGNDAKIMRRGTGAME